MTQVAAGIDIGGTKIGLGLVDDQGALLARAQVPTLVEQGPEAGMDRTMAALDSMLASLTGAALQGIGVGCAGPLDGPKGLIQNPFTLPGWEGFDVLAPLRQRYGVSAQLENDADVAALGEAWCGSGRGYRNQIYITVSTGIGSGVVIGGRLYRGSGNAGEVGHMIIEMDGPLCNCGRRGCLEALSAGPAIVQQALAGSGPGREELVLAGTPTAEQITAAAKAGNPYAQAVVARAARALGIGVANAVVTLAPDAVVLGGGVMAAWELFIGAIEKEVAGAALMIYAEHVPVLRASLPNPGVIGAARVVWEGRQNH